MRKSLLEPDLIVAAANLLTKDGRILLPTDVVVKTALTGSAPVRTAAIADVHRDELIADIGPRTAATYAAEISRAGTVFWNGPMGIFENPQFGTGTRTVALALVASSTTTVVGGGNTVEAVNRAGVADQLTHVSTGGGAALEFLEGRSLPGIAALKPLTSQLPGFRSNVNRTRELS